MHSYECHVIPFGNAAISITRVTELCALLLTNAREFASRLGRYNLLAYPSQEPLVLIVLCQEGLPDCQESFAKPALAYIGRSIKVFLITSVGFSLTLIVVAKCKNPLLVYNTKGVSASIE
jgi:hypothetical protein